MHSRTGINISIIPAALIIYAVLVLCPFSNAYADYAEPESYSYQFLEEMAEEAGVTPNQFVINYVFMSQVYTGTPLTNISGISLTNNVEENLANVKETPDFPDWDTLTEQQKAGWTEINYNAERFNELVMAGSGGRGLNNAKEDFYGSGGSDFSWTDTAHDAIVGIGNIAKNILVNGAGALFGDIASQFDVNAKDNIGIFLGTPHGVEVRGEDYENWPSNAPATLYVNKCNRSFTYFTVGTDNEYLLTSASEDVYMIAYFASGTNPSNTGFTFKMFSKNPFTANYQSFSNINNVQYPVPSVSASVRTTPDTYYVYAVQGMSLRNKNFIESDISITGNGSFLTYQQDTAINQCIPIILFGNDLNFNGVLIPGYPDVIQNNINVYYPVNGFNDETNWNAYVTAPDSGSGGEGEIDLTEITTILRSIETKLGLIDSTSEDLTNLETALARFQFYANGILKVHDVGVYDSLTDIGTDIHDILTTLISWPKGDAPDAPDIIGDFDFDELQDKSDLLLESVSDLAPFGALLLMSEMVGILSQTGNLADPEFVIPFQFMAGHTYDVTIDLSWMEDGKIYFNFVCILSLIMCLLNITVRIIELEAAS